MRRPIPAVLLALLAACALPGVAQAAPVKLSPTASAVSARGVATIEAANPTAHVLRGKATVTVAGRTVASRTVRLPRRAVTALGLRFDAEALAALRSAGGRATIKLRVRRAAGGRTMSARRTLTLRLPAAAPSAPAPAPAPGPGSPVPPPSGGPAPTTPGPAAWVGRMGTEGPYDDLELTLAGGQLQITKAPTVPVSCMENGGSYRIALSFELWDAPGPWTLGADELVTKQGIAVNQLVSAGARTMNFRVTGAAQEPGRITGTLGISFSDSRYDVFDKTMTFINCAGSQSFEAVPAG